MSKHLNQVRKAVRANDRAELVQIAVDESQPSKLRSRAVRELIAFRDAAAIEPVAHLVHDGDSIVRVQTIVGLGMSGGLDCVPTLLDFACSSSPLPERRDAVQAASSILRRVVVGGTSVPQDGTAAVSRLVNLLADADWMIRSEATEGLGRLRQRPDEVRRMLEDKSFTVRTSAVDSLIRMEDRSSLPDMWSAVSRSRSPLARRILRRMIRRFEQREIGS